MADTLLEKINKQFKSNTGRDPDIQRIRKSGRLPTSEAREAVRQGNATPEQAAMARGAIAADVEAEAFKDSLRVQAGLKKSEEEKEQEARDKKERSPGQAMGQAAARIAKNRRIKEDLIEQEIDMLTEAGLSDELAQTTSLHTRSVRAMNRAIATDQDSLAMFEVASSMGVTKVNAFVRMWDDMTDALVAYHRAVQAGGDPDQERDKFMALHNGMSVEEMARRLKRMNDRKALINDRPRDVPADELNR